MKSISQSEYDKNTYTIEDILDRSVLNPNVKANFSLVATRMEGRCVVVSPEKPMNDALK